MYFFKFWRNKLFINLCRTYIVKVGRRTTFAFNTSTWICSEWYQWTHLCRFAIDSMSKFHLESSWKFHWFWKANSRGIMTSIPRGNFDVGSAFKIEEISMSSPRGFLYAVSTSNWRNFWTPLYHFLKSFAPGTFLSYSDIVLTWLNFIVIVVMTDIWNYWNYIMGEVLQQRK